MGLVCSRVSKGESVRRSRERKRLMKRLLSCQQNFAAAHHAYLRSLRNAGATLRQFAEADSSISLPRGAPLSPPPLFPPPPPLPPFSPEEIRSPPSPAEDGTALGLGETFLWVETIKGNSSAEEIPKNLVDAVREIDEYFLKASAGGTRVAALMEPRRGCSLHQLFEETRGKNFKSAKVFSSLSWRWSSRLPSSEALRNVHQPGPHSSTLEKLLAEEDKLYKLVKEEEMMKLEFGNKLALLREQEASGQDWTISAKTRSSMDALQMEIMSLHESISQTCSSISMLRDTELLPQLLELCSGLTEMWQCMHDCHEGQNMVAKQMSHLPELLPVTEPTSESHIEAAAQLVTELKAWESSFHGLLNAQRKYASMLGLWARLTDCLPTASHGSTGPLATIIHFCEDWLLCLDRFLNEVPLEAIKSFISRVQSIQLQLVEEQKHQRKSIMLEKKLTRKLGSPVTEEKEDGGNDDDGGRRGGSRAKMAVMRKRLEEEKGKYLSSVQQSRTIIIQSLQCGLPEMFRALMTFTSVGAHAFGRIRKLTGDDGQTVNVGSSAM